MRIGQMSVCRSEMMTIIVNHDRRRTMGFACFDVDLVVSGTVVGDPFHGGGDGVDDLLIEDTDAIR